MTNFDEVLFLSVDEVLDLHSDQLRLFGGSAGVRDRNALDSAVATPASALMALFYTTISSTWLRPMPSTWQRISRS
jgi:prophage maintenance system killer protein